MKKIGVGIGLVIGVMLFNALYIKCVYEWGVEPILGFIGIKSIDISYCVFLLLIAMSYCISSLIGKRGEEVEAEEALKRTGIGIINKFIPLLILYIAHLFV